MSTNMKAVIINEYGDNSVVRLAEIALPEPQAGEVRIRIHAAGVNPVDWKIRDGAGQRMGMTLPIHLGSEISGTIDRLGDGAGRFRVGDAVYGIVAAGGFAGYAIARAADIALKPASLDFTEAAAVPLGALTSWQALFDVARLARGQRLFVTNASGGVGSLAVQLAKSIGAHVTAMASAGNEAWVRSLGADAFIAHDRQVFEQAAQDMDVVFDTVGGEIFRRAFATLRKGGCLVTAVAFPQDEAQQYGVHAARVACQPDAGQLAAIGELADAGKLRAKVGSVLPLADVRQALELVQRGRTGGKVVLQLAP
ncbi:NADP-dependent oxidoreductase [Janthinobacterium sp.]|uniref:NADP-dependent oxidoreductase n=1 Tax=Janthinobacterium sp. TaxID=1871054 RepID=UPI00289C85D3|nr:NADP-dependent oxidoreductase [Janthinobacterium sp.]